VITTNSTSLAEDSGLCEGRRPPRIRQPGESLAGFWFATTFHRHLHSPGWSSRATIARSSVLNPLPNSPMAWRANSGCGPNAFRSSADE
jgi:hypothetical protein